MTPRERATELWADIDGVGYTAKTDGEFARIDERNIDRIASAIEAAVAEATEPLHAEIKRLQEEADQDADESHGPSKSSIDDLKRPNADHLHAHIDENGRTIASFENREDAELFRSVKERPRADDVDHVADPSQSGLLATNSDVWDGDIPNPHYAAPVIPDHLQ